MSAKGRTSRPQQSATKWQSKRSGWKGVWEDRERFNWNRFEIVENIERGLITDMLEKCGWNQTEAAEHFKVPLSTLNQKIRRLNIEIKKKHRA